MSVQVVNNLISFQRMSLPISLFLMHFEIFFAYYFEGKQENIPISIKGLGFVKNVKEALKSSKPIMCIADGILTLIISLC